MFHQFFSFTSFLYFLHLHNVCCWMPLFYAAMSVQLSIFVLNKLEFLCPCCLYSHAPWGVLIWNVQFVDLVEKKLLSDRCMLLFLDKCTKKFIFCAFFSLPVNQNIITDHFSELIVKRQRSFVKNWRYRMIGTLIKFHAILS